VADPLGFGVESAGLFPVCAGAIWPNFLEAGVTLDSEVDITDDTQKPAFTVVFTTGDGTDSVFTLIFSYAD
jgi:hypothetical protein